MVSISTKTKDRLVSGLKKFQPILIKMRTADVNESDTVTVIADMLADIFGYDKYLEITSEFAVKKTFCDLAIMLDGKPSFLIECKAIGLTLKDDHIRQATNYAADSGIEWVILTNGIDWKIYKVLFIKPIDKELVYEFDLSALNPKRQVDLETLYYLCREAFIKTSKTGLDELHTKMQILNKFMLAQLIQSEPVLDAIRKQLKKLSADLKPTNDELGQIVRDELLKREVTEGEKTVEAKKQLQKLERAAKTAKAKSTKLVDSIE